MKLVKQTPKRSSLIVELDPVDIDVLAHILRRVGGDPEGPRGVADQLLEMLRKAGGRWDLDMVDDSTSHGHLYMIDTFPEDCGK